MKLILPKPYEPVRDLMNNATAPNRFDFEMDMDIEDMYEQVSSQSRPWCTIAAAINSKYKTTFNNKQIEKHYTTPFRKKKFTALQNLYVMTVRILYPHAGLREIASEIGCYKKIIKNIFNRNLLRSPELQQLSIAKDNLSKIVNTLPNNKYDFVSLKTFKKVQKDVESLIENTQALPPRETSLADDLDNMSASLKYAF